MLQHCIKKAVICGYEKRRLFVHCEHLLVIYWDIGKTNLYIYKGVEVFSFATVWRLNCWMYIDK